MNNLNPASPTLKEEALGLLLEMQQRSLFQRRHSEVFLALAVNSLFEDRIATVGVYTRQKHSGRILLSVMACRNLDDDKHCLYFFPNGMAVQGEQQAMRAMRSVYSLSHHSIEILEVSRSYLDGLLRGGNLNDSDIESRIAQYREYAIAAWPEYISPA